MSQSLPRLLDCTQDLSARLELDGGTVEVAVGGEVAGYALRAAWLEDGRPYAALEDAEQIAIVCTGEPSVQARLSRPFGHPAELAREHLPRFDDAYYDGIMDSDEDVLGRQVLEQGEPSFAAVADLLPPVLDMTFLGDDRGPERPIVRPDGTIDGQFGAAFDFDTRDDTKHYCHGLLGGRLNVVCYGAFDESTGRGAELIAFALADGPDGEVSVYRRLRETGAVDGEVVSHHWACNECVAVQSRFYAALWRAYRRDTEFLGTGARIVVPEVPVQEGVQASLRLADLAYAGVLPRYGIGYYDQPMHDSFPPSTIFLVWTHLQWGRLQRARDILSHYLSRRVNEDGTFDYYGPAVAEYGQMLTLAARYARLSGDTEWWHGYLVILRRIAGRLVALRHESMGGNAGDELHCGLIRGLPEADYHDSEAEWSKYYYAGDVWVCRGLREIGRVMREDWVTAAEGTRMVEEAEAYAQDILRYVAAATDPASGFVPAGPDEPPPFQRMTESRHASYCNYRYLPEMLSAGVLSRGTVRAIVDWRRSHGGELLGMTRFSDHLDDWPEWHLAKGILHLDDVAGYLLTFYGHLCHHHSRGNWASYEQVFIDTRGEGHRRLYSHAEQVVPCQVMGALMLRDMLVCEDWDEESLYLLRACPGAWLTAEEGVSAEGVPTRWGTVSLRARMEGGKLGVTVGFAGRGGRSPERVVLRVALPGRRMRSVDVNGEATDRLEPETSTLVLAGLPEGEMRVVVEYG